MTPAVRLEARHAFFANARCPDITFEPVEETRALLASHSLLCRSDAGTLVVYRSASVHAESSVDLTFRLRATAKDFAQYTNLDRAGARTTLWFDAAVAPAAPIGVDATDRRLHPSEHVSAADRVALDAPALHGVVTPHDLADPPVAFVRVRLAPSTPSAPTHATTWFVAFEARATIWTYLVVGAGNAAPTIVDVNDAIAFAPAVTTVLPDNRRAFVLRSTVPIPFRQHQTQHFQLRVATPHGERVLLDRLPLASSSALREDALDGRDVWVSEIYVNL